MKNLLNTFILVRGAAAVLLLVFSSGCVSGSMVLRKHIDITEKIAIANVTMPWIADASQPANRKVLFDSLEYAWSRVAMDLKTVKPWSILDLPASKLQKTMRTFGIFSAEDIQQKYPGAGNADFAKKEIDRERSKWAEQYLGAASLPPVPRRALVSENNDQQGSDLIPPLARAQAAKLCTILGVDAVVFVFIDAEVAHRRENTFIVKDNRTDGSVRMASTLVMVNSTGQVIADLGRPQLDDQAPSRDLLPLYRGVGRDAIRPENVDLADPEKKIARGLQNIVNEASAAMAVRFRQTAGYLPQGAGQEGNGDRDSRDYR